MIAVGSRRTTIRLSFICGLVAFLPGGARPQQQIAEVPYLSGRITDNAEIFSQDSRGRLAAMMKAHEDATTNQIAILTMPSLENGSVEEFAARVFESWKLGRKGKDNGVLIIISPGDKRARIEVGRGLQGRITEEAAGRIVRDLMTPSFNLGDYDQGMEDGLRVVIGMLDVPGTPETATQEKAQASSEFFSGVEDIPITERILIGAFIFGIIGLFTIIGVVTPGAGWFLYLFLIPFWAMFPIIVVGTHGALVLLIIYLVGFPAAKLYLTRSVWYAKAKEALRIKGAAHIGGFFVSRKDASQHLWSSASQPQE